jgi:flagellar hook-length control protein FliK
MPETVRQVGQPDESAVGSVNGKALQNNATATPVQGQAGAALMQATAGSVLNPESTPKSGVVAASTATSKNDALLKIVVSESAVDGKQQVSSESLSVNRQGSDSAKPAEEVPVSQAPASPAKSVTVMKDALSMQTARQPETRPALADAAVSTVIAASPQEQADTSTLARTAHAPQAVHPNPGVSAQEAGIKRSDNQEDGTRQRLDTGAIKKSLLNEVAEFPKVVASSAAEKEFANDGDKGTSDHFMNGQSSLTATHLQLKPESGIASATASVAGQGEAVRSDVSENVVKQVREVFANRDIKQGSEQITLKLTPENLGELTVNLKMENQQLRIEIVAENRSVKDALLQHTDTLKDSLSRQNITMESFDVTTGGSQQGFAQGDKGWRQLAQQQLAAWAPTGGYRTAAREVSAEIMPRYNTQSQYTMLDVHF